MTDLPYAEDVNYWRTGQSSPDVWIDKAQKEIARAGGQVLAEMFGREEMSGHAAYMLGFQFGGERYKAIWPVLESKSGDERAARRQAATMLYHDIKNSCMKAKVLGVRVAFLGYFLLPDGRTASQAASADLLEILPRLDLALPSGERR